MKNSILSLLLFFLSFGLFAQQNFKLSTCEIQLAGTSTLHDWTADVEDITGNGTFELTDGNLSAITSLKVDMKAKSIKSNKGSMMDKNIYEALKTDDFKNISFDFASQKAMTKTDEGFEVKTTGKLTVAGVTKTVNLTAKAQKNGTGKWVFTGSTQLKMTDFNVEPPELFFGSLKTADEVTVIFEATFSSSIDQ